MNAATPFGVRSVEHTPEIDRIAALPRRVWSDEAAIDLAARLTRELKTPGGTMTLKPVQAIALYEAMECGGLFGPIKVGGGKTLLSALLPLVLEAKRPILLLPAALVEKTWKEFRELSKHWRVPTNIQIESYEMLSLVQSARKLEYIQPDFLETDEAHYIKNHRAGRTRRVVRYMQQHPETRFAAFSGTMIKSSIRDFAHFVRWALKEGAPVPKTDDEVSAWADALDEKVNPLGRRQAGALLQFGGSSAREAFQRRLLETPGVVASSATDGVDCSLRISALEYTASETTAGHFEVLRKTFTTPDGWTFSAKVLLRMYLRQLALGFHSVWSPRPPPEWIEARRDWASFVRDTLPDSESLDTELQVANAVDAGRLQTGTLNAWRRVRDSYKIEPKDVWHDDVALQACAAWMADEKGIVWVEHVFFGRKLAELTGAPYYGPKGLDAQGQSIVNVKPGKAIIASVAANGTGRNLQMFSKNLITSCPTLALTVEQLIGRTHREGQEADEVTVDILLGCREHHDAFYRALDGAEATAETLGDQQKLLLADLVIPNIQHKTGPLWGKRK